MVRGIVFVSAICAALIVSVSAAPSCGRYCDDDIIGINGGDHIGTGFIDLSGVGEELVNAPDLEVEDILNDGRVLDDEDNMRMYGGGHPRHIYHPDAESGHGCDDSYDSCDHRSDSLHFLKREEASTKTAKKMMKKMLAKKY